MTRIVLEPAYEERETVRTLFKEYAVSLGIDLCFQDFDEELQTLPGKYALPDGRLYIARVDGLVAGCVGLRRFDLTRCEMKRLYVRPQSRGKGVGRLLVERIVADALAMGYAAMLLDTLQSLPEALALYRANGFVEIGAYCHNPQPDVVYMVKPLRISGNTAT